MRCAHGPLAVRASAASCRALRWGCRPFPDAAALLESSGWRVRIAAHHALFGRLCACAPQPGKAIGLPPALSRWSAAQPIQSSASKPTATAALAAAEIRPLGAPPSAADTSYQRASPAQGIVREAVLASPAAGTTSYGVPRHSHPPEPQGRPHLDGDAVGTPSPASAGPLTASRLTYAGPRPGARSSAAADAKLWRAQSLCCSWLCRRRPTRAAAAL